MSIAYRSSSMPLIPRTHPNEEPRYEAETLRLTPERGSSGPQLTPHRRSNTPLNGGCSVTVLAPEAVD